MFLAWEFLAFATGFRSSVHALEIRACVFFSGAALTASDDVKPASATIGSAFANKVSLKLQVQSSIDMRFLTFISVFTFLPHVFARARGKRCFAEAVNKSSLSDWLGDRSVWEFALAWTLQNREQVSSCRVHVFIFVCVGPETAGGNCILWSFTAVVLEFAGS